MAETKVTRISAKDSSTKTVKVSGKKSAAPKKRSPVRDRSDMHPILRGLISIGGYFKGAWIELRQVRWPSRSATWSLTLAVILFSAFFAVIILLLDLLFKYLFELILS
ncbi:MAG: preprotein translocase subunit SecE [Candidatus Microsaccharimonas sp.]